MTYTKQHSCIALINDKENIEKPEFTESLNPKTLLLDSLDKQNIIFLEKISLKGSTFYEFQEYQN